MCEMNIYVLFIFPVRASCLFFIISLFHDNNNTK